jgi:hypothetical protein
MIFTYVYIEKNLLFQNQQSNFNQTWYKLFLGKGNSKLFKLGVGLHQRGDYYKNAKMGWGHLKTFFSRTTELEELIFTYMKAF